MTKSIPLAKMAALLVAATTLSACATKAGRNFDAGYAPEIKPGVTTKADVRSRLGRPILVSRGTDLDTWTYSYYEGGGMSTALRTMFWGADPVNPLGSQQKTLKVSFKGDTVSDVKFTRDLPPPDPLEEAYR